MRTHERIERSANDFSDLTSKGPSNVADKFVGIRNFYAIFTEFRTKHMNQVRRKEDGEEKETEIKLGKR